LQQRDHLGGKQPNLAAIDRERPEHDVVATDRHGKVSAGTGDVDESATDGVTAPISIVVSGVEDLNITFAAHKATNAGSGTQFDRMIREHIGKSGRRAQIGDNLVHVIAQIDGKGTKAGSAKPRCSFEDRVEHRLQVAGRIVDDFQDLRHRGLARQRLLGLVEQPRVLDGDDGLVGEGLQEMDRLVVERSSFAARDADRADRNAIAQHRHDEQAAPADRAGQFLYAVGAIGVLDIDVEDNLAGPRRLGMNSF
jgi:hypothetical protein